MASVADDRYIAPDYEKRASNGSSSVEKQGKPGRVEEAPFRDELLPDPDAGLSEEERKQIVSRDGPKRLLRSKLTYWKGAQTSVEARSAIDSLGMSLIASRDPEENRLADNLR